MKKLPGSSTRDHLSRHFYCVLISCCNIALLFFSSTETFAQSDTKKSITPKVILKRGSSIYAAPASSSRPVKQAERLSIFFFLNEKTVAGTESFYEIGETPAKSLGWVQASHALKWNHRLLFNGAAMTSNSSVLLFADYVAADKAAQSGQSEPKAEVQSFVKKYPDVLFPIIERKEIGKSILCKVGLLSAGETEGAYSTDVDWFIVLNLGTHASSSLKTIRQVIQEVTEINAQQHKLGLRLGVLGLQNTGKNQEYVFNQLLPLTRRETDAINLLSEKIVLSGAKKAEKLSDIFLHAVKETPWAPQSLRTIIFVEHAGDANLEKAEALEKVLTGAGDNQVRFIAVSIASNRQEENQAHDQFLQLLAAGKTAENYGVLIAAKSSEDLRAQLRQTLERELNLAKRYVTAVKAPSAANQQTSLDPRTAKYVWMVVPDASSPSAALPFVFASRDELTLYLFSLRTMTTMTSSPAEALKKIAAPTLSLLLGETLRPEEVSANLSEISKWLPYQSELLRASSDPNQALQTIMKKISELESYLGNPNSWMQAGGGKTPYTLVPLNLIP